MDHHDGLMIGMFWGGLLVASVPILLTLGVGIFVFQRWRRERRGSQEDLSSPTRELRGRR
jgi:hypothetical protein